MATYLRCGVVDDFIGTASDVVGFFIDLSIAANLGGGFEGLVSTTANPVIGILLIKTSITTNVSRYVINDWLFIVFVHTTIITVIAVVTSLWQWCHDFVRAADGFIVFERLVTATAVFVRRVRDVVDGAFTTDLTAAVIRLQSCKK